MFHQAALGQSVNNKKLAPGRTVASAVNDKDQLAQELIEALAISKAVETSVENSGAYFKNVPNDPNPVLQKKISSLYQEAQKKFDAQKVQQKNQVLAEIKQQFTNQFNLEELKYLVVLSKYPVYRRFQSFLESERYNDILSKPFVANREAVAKLKEQLKELKTSGPVTQPKK